MRDETAAAAATHHIMLGHGLALKALRATAGSEAKIGITVDPNPYVAYDESGHAVADILDAEYNRMFLDPCCRAATRSAHEPTRCRRTR